MNIAVITGASSGMGKEFARRLILEKDEFCGAPFDELWIIARSQDKLQELKEELDSARLSDNTANPTSIRVIPMDLTASDTTSSLSALLQQEKPSVCLLINCAGMGKSGAFETQSVEDTHSAITLNCTALSEVTSVMLPYMIPLGDSSPKGKGPRILNIASSAGFLPQPNFAVYAATKSYVISFSRALDQEVRRHNIAVTCVCPGPVDTNFIKVSKNDPNASFTGFKAKFVTTVDKLIPASIKASQKGRSMLVFGFGQKCLHLASKILPTRLIFFFEKGMK